MNQAELIWMNGEFVPWEDAKVHVLTHGLHYGTGRLRGRPLLRHRDRPGGLPPRRPHRPPVPVGRALLHADARTTARRCAQATLELIARNGLRSCYIRPLVYRGYGTMGLFPLDAPVDVTIAVWEWGAYLGEEGKRNGVRAKVSCWRRISHDSLIPHAKACGQYLNSSPGQDREPQGRLRGGDPPRRRRQRLRGLGREHLRRARRARSPRRRRPRRSSTASAASRSSRSRATWASRSSSATSPAPSSTSPTSCSCCGTAAELTPVREVDDHADRRRQARRDHARGPDRRSRTRCTAAPSATATGSTRCRPSSTRSPRPQIWSRRRRRHRALRRHPARRHAGRGACR